MATYGMRLGLLLGCLMWVGTVPAEEPIERLPAAIATDPPGRKIRAAALTNGVVARPSDANEADVPEMFRLPPGKFEFRREDLRTLDESAAKANVWFPSPLETDHEPNNVVHCEYFLPRPSDKRKVPGVVVLHILGGDFELARAFCLNLNRMDVAALFLKMPYYGPRREAGHNIRMISEDPRQTVAGMRQAVLDVRRAADWLSAQPEIDAGQLGIMGISLGGITSALSAGVEPRYRKVGLLLAGGDAAQFPWGSPKLVKMRQYWERSGFTQESLISTLRPIDPVTYAHRLRGRNVIMLNAAHDEIIPRGCTEALWEAAGKPKIQWWDAGHITAIRHLVDAMRITADHFADERHAAMLRARADAAAEMP